MTGTSGICHWGPLLALSIIITLFLCGLYCTLLWFPPWTSVGSAIHLAVFISWLILIMNYFLKSIWLGPGYLPLRWKQVRLYTVGSLRELTSTVSSPKHIYLVCLIHVLCSCRKCPYSPKESFCFVPPSPGNSSQASYFGF